MNTKCSFLNQPVIRDNSCNSCIKKEAEGLCNCGLGLSKFSNLAKSYFLMLR
jgi:hypothetical protein